MSESEFLNSKKIRECVREFCNLEYIYTGKKIECTCLENDDEYNLVDEFYKETNWDTKFVSYYIVIMGLLCNYRKMKLQIRFCESEKRLEELRN